MQLTTSTEQAERPVTVLHIDGELDGATYEELIAFGHQLYLDGTRNLLLDLRKMTYMSSSGLIALHTLALILRGESLPDSDDGWGSFGALRNAVAGDHVEKQVHLKLLGPIPQVARALEMSGMVRLFDIYDDLNTAITTF